MQDLGDFKTCLKHTKAVQKKNGKVVCNVPEQKHTES